MSEPAQPVSDVAASILADAAALDAGQAIKPGAPAAPAAVEVDSAELARIAAGQLVDMVAPVVLPLVAWRFGEPLAKAYGPQQLGAIAAALAAVAVKRGWQLDGLVDSAPELMLASAVIGPVVPFALARMQQARAGEVEQLAPAAPAAAVEVTSPAPAPGGSGFDGR